MVPFAYSSLLFIFGVITINSTSYGIIISIAQAFFSLLTIVVAIWLVFYQQRKEREKHEKTIKEKETLYLLSLYSLARELAKMLVLSNLQKVEVNTNVFYSNIQNEFETLARMLSELPLSQAAQYGQVEKLLRIRRIAIQVGEIFRSDTNTEGDAFFIKYRNIINPLEHECHQYIIELKERIDILAPGRFPDEHNFL
ncbi:hypothetical protein [Pseudomonas saxonica]|uniref:Uncharacterized protein n=1 Tax=Pseudomonas saxonica TaxID=2600598 RepID=A0A5C5PTR1_9PSED|nr:hypothetical protein [Pseudomonas saxonica]TWR85730.1 hypothetical protein FJD37_18990 [Pseudomonas saxonica]WRQ75014.1 hypothetical protein VQY67_23885 [Pseudomonas saxonica]